MFDLRTSVFSHFGFQCYWGCKTPVTELYKKLHPKLQCLYFLYLKVFVDFVYTFNAPWKFGSLLP